MKFFVARRVFFVLDNNRDDTAECFVSWRQELTASLRAVSINIFEHSKRRFLMSSVLEITEIKSILLWLHLSASLIDKNFLSGF